MESIAEGIAAQAAAPRFEDGCINLQETIRLIAEQVVNGIMDAEADQLCGGTGHISPPIIQKVMATSTGDFIVELVATDGCEFARRLIARPDRSRHVSGTSAHLSRHITENPRAALPNTR